MTSTSSETEPTTGPGASPRSADAAELAELRLRVAAQARLIEAMIGENADIHVLRRRNHQLEQYVGRLLELAPVRAALVARRRLLHLPGPGD